MKMAAALIVQSRRLMFYRLYARTAGFSRNFSYNFGKAS
jgi:hypothetical protein